MSVAFIIIMAAAAAAAVIVTGYTYWFSRDTVAAGDVYGISVGSTGNVYALSTGSFAYTSVLEKLTFEGVPIWAIAFTGWSVGYRVTTKVKIDTSEAAFIAIAPAPTGSALHKISNTGALLWQKSLTSGGSYIESLAVSQTSGDVYFCVGPQINVIRVSGSTGALVWGRVLTPSVRNVYPSGICLDSTNSVLVVGLDYSISATSYGGYIAKYNSSGTLQWQQVLQPISFSSLNYVSFSAVAVDASDNIYVVGRMRDASAPSDDALIVAKFSPAGAIQWQRRLSVGASGASVSVSGSFLYIGGTRSTNGLIVCYSTAGVYQWGRILTGSPGTVTDIHVNGSGIIYFGASGIAPRLVGRLPASGNGTGTWGGVTYSGVSLTDVDASTYNTAVAGALVDTATSYTMNASSYGIITYSTTALTLAQVVYP